MDVIIAPHGDDEVIGCYTILIAEPYLVFHADGVDVGSETFSDCVNEYINCTFHFPDPIFETHPDHRKWGSAGEHLLRSKGLDVWFYSVNMRAPYIFEVKDPEGKRRMLDDLYPDKKGLWESDHRYFLFEGHCKWIM